MTHYRSFAATGVTIAAAAALIATTTAASAGKLERGNRNIMPIFERGTYAEISGAFIFPHASGNDDAGNEFGNFYQRDTDFGGAFKIDWTDRLSSAYIVDEPFGADIAYDSAPLGTPIRGGTADGTFATLSSIAITSLTRYKFDENWSVYGGTRSQRTEFEVGIPVFAAGADYRAKAKADWGFGWVAGVAWEMPAIRARASLTYHSEIEHTWTLTERNSPIFGPVSQSRFTNQTPQGVDFDFRFPVAQTTLMYGNVHWADFSETALSLPTVTAIAGAPVLDYEGDNWSVKLGVAQVMRPDWILAGDVTYEFSSGEQRSPFRAGDGEVSLGLSSRHQYQGANITFGAQYKIIEDNEGPVTFPGGVNFRDQDVFTAGVKIGFNFVPQAKPSLK
ncbi:MAG: hypothetical protein AAFZ01_01770 [Pseudomonadota bacterium]